MSVVRLHIMVLFDWSSQVVLLKVAYSLHEEARTERRRIKVNKFDLLCTCTDTLDNMHRRLAPEIYILVQ